MASLDENPFLDLGRQPIPGADPCGTDVGDDEAYIFVVGEVGKLDRIESDEPDWHSMQRSATELLRTKSKDVEVASALGLALFKVYGYAGLSAWMAMTTELINNFWDGLFPARPRRRKSRIEVVTDYFSERGWFWENQPKGDDFDALDQCAVRIAELEAALTGKMPDDGPDFKKFIRSLKEQCAKRPAAAAPAAPPAAPSGAPGAPAAPVAGGFVAAEVADSGSAVTAVMSAAAFLRKADPTDPLPYAWVRAIKWSKISLPTSDDGKYEITPPEKSVIETLEHQYSKQMWENLLKNAEAGFRTSDPLWLDVQRYVCAALRGLGSTHEKALEAVITATAGLVRRLGEELFDLRFKGGQALCGGETRIWIESEVAAKPGGGGQGGGSAANGKLTKASGKARKLVASGKLKEAVASLQEGLTTCTQRRDRLLWRLHIAQLCFEAQRLKLAGPLLEDCYQEIQKFGIDEWEPTLAVNVAETLYRCRKSLASSEKAPTPGTLEKVRDSYAWLCQLDPVAALAAEPSGK